MTANHGRRCQYSAAVLRQKINDDLSTAEALIVKLRRELDDARREQQNLLRDRERVLDRIAALELEHDQRLDETAQLANLQQERGDVTSALQRLEEQNGALEEMCLELREQLATEREGHAATLREVRCLEQQVDDLQSLLDLLSTDGSPARKTG